MRSDEDKFEVDGTLRAYTASAWKPLAMSNVGQTILTA